jgi:TFIIF-interacting CTD phosphatase-like protein
MLLIDEDEESKEANISEVDPGSYTQETVQTDDELIADNVQTFLNMAQLQQTYAVHTVLNNMKKRLKLRRSMIEMEDMRLISKQVIKRKPKKLLLLDMDETLLHAATLSDIYDAKLYGQDAEPSFCTQFYDRDQRIEIGVFLRPFLLEMVY